jgi:hypothetical protein
MRSAVSVAYVAVTPSNVRLQFDFKQVLQRALYAFDPRAQHGLSPHVHTHEKVRVRDNPQNKGLIYKI